MGSRQRMNGALLGWSPDGQSVLTWNNSAIIASGTDGLEVQAWAGLPSLAWLTNSRALVIAPEDLTVRSSPLTVFRVDPQTGVRTDLQIPLDDSPDLMHITDVLAARNLHLHPTAFHDFHRVAPLPDGGWAYIEWSDAVKQMNAPLCATWELRRTQPDDVLLTSLDTTFLSDLTALPDGSLLFLRWTLNGCRFLGGTTVELLRLVPGEEPR